MYNQALVHFQHCPEDNEGHGQDIPGAHFHSYNGSYHGHVPISADIPPPEYPSVPHALCAPEI